MKRMKHLRGILALTLVCGMLQPSLVKENVYAQDNLPVTRYATPEQALEAFDTDSGTADKIAKKVLFGKDASGAALEWYIAGKDPVGGGMVLVSAAPYETGLIFNSESPNRTKPYESDPSIIYDNGDPKEIWYNHYGTSDIRAALNGEESLSAHFTQAEEEMLIESTVATKDTNNDVLYKTVDKVYLPSAGDARFGDGEREGIIKFFVGSSVEDGPHGNLIFSPEYWSVPMYSRSPRQEISYHVLTGRNFTFGVREVGTADLDDKTNTVAVIQIDTDVIDHFEADSDDAAFDIIYKNGGPVEPEPESFGELIINDAGNAIDVRGITGEVTLCVEKDGNIYKKNISTDISYPVNLLSFDGVFIENLDGAEVYLEKDGVKEAARQREFYEYDNVLVTDEEGAIVSVTDNNHVPNDSSQGPAEYAFDNNRSTFYHTEWNPEYIVSSDNPAVVTVEFRDVMENIHQMAYLQRRDGGKGNFISFQINYKVNEGDEWILAENVSFDGTSDSEMRFVSFDPIDAKYIQLVITEGSGSHAAASEIDFFRFVDERFAVLDEAVANAESFIESAQNYTEESIAEIRSMINAAEIIRNNPDASNEEIEKAVNDLNSAVSLAEPTNLAELKSRYDEANAIQNNNYTSATWLALKNSLSKANAILIGSGRTYEMVEDAIAAINAAIDGLRYNLDLSALQALVSESSALHKEDHEEQGWSEFTEALEAAKAILASAEQITQDEVDTAEANLQKAKGNLQAKFDKDELRELISHCRDYMFVDTRYTKESYDKLWDAIDAAELIEADIDTTQELIDEAVADLKAAEEYLLANRIPDNIKIMLREKVAELESFVSSADNKAMYTSSSWDTLETVYAAAKEFSDSLELTQNPMRDLYTHYTALEDAVAALEYKPADYSRVEEAKEKAEALNKEEYKDFTRVEEAISQIDWDKNITEQSEVDAMAQAIEDAIAALEKIEEQDKPVTEEPGQDRPEAGDADQTDDASGRSEVSTVPQTGDGSDIFVWLLIGIASGAGFGAASLWLRRKRQQAG